MVCRLWKPPCNAPTPWSAMSCAPTTPTNWSWCAAWPCPPPPPMSRKRPSAGGRTVLPSCKLRSIPTPARSPPDASCSCAPTWCRRSRPMISNSWSTSPSRRTTRSPARAWQSAAGLLPPPAYKRWRSTVSPPGRWMWTGVGASLSISSPGSTPSPSRLPPRARSRCRKPSRSASTTRRRSRPPGWTRCFRGSRSPAIPCWKITTATAGAPCRSSPWAATRCIPTPPPASPIPPIRWSLRFGYLSATGARRFR